MISPTLSGRFGCYRHELWVNPLTLGEYSDTSNSVKKLTIIMVYFVHLYLFNLSPRIVRPFCKYVDDGGIASEIRYT